jgi:hypothetical protein
MLKSMNAIALAAGVAALALAGTVPPSHAAQKIVCWKDKSGKVIGCGDTVPPEYRDHAAKELDSRGITRRTIDTAAEDAKRREKEKALADARQEEARRLAEQARQDKALLATYASAQEIDQRRDRDIQAVDLQIVQIQATLKNADSRYEEAKKRNHKDDMARAAADKKRAEDMIAEREKEKTAIREKYAEQKKRYLELKGGAQSAATPATGQAPGK